MILVSVGRKRFKQVKVRTGKNSCHREGECSMGETPDQIERHIYEKRGELGENIHELQQKVKTAVDWRAQFDQRPWVLMGAAFGGGLLLALLFGAEATQAVPRHPMPGSVKLIAPAMCKSGTTRLMPSGKTFVAQR